MRHGWPNRRHGQDVSRCSSRADMPTACRSTRFNYLCCKLVLKPNHFRSRKSLFDFAKILREPAEQHDVTFSMGHFRDEPIQIREVLFVDTPDFRLYNNAFILRRRIRYEDGFPIGDPEIVFKFRHPDMQTGGRDGRSTADSRRPSGQVQVSGPAAQGPARRNPPAVFPQRAVPAFQRRTRTTCCRWAR